MSELRGACIIGQSGGPTAVINASALGVIRTALDTDCITRVLGAANGIQGVLEDRLYDMGQEDAGELELLRYTPSSALGSCRYKLADPSQDDTDYRRILEIFRKYDVRYFFYNGGNDSMDTCNKISKYMQSVGYACRVIGVPKTIDNDLNGTDHCPGFGSAARYIATTCMEVQRDTHVYDNGTITVLEIMGRHAGWLAGSAALAAWVGYGPDLIYLPEVDFDMERFLADVHQVYQAKNKCLIAVSEGIHRADGAFIAEGVSAAANDGFGHTQLGGLAALLADLIAPDHAQAGEEGRGPLLHAVDVVGGRLLVQRVHHAAPGGVHHQSFGVRRPLGQLQQGQLVGHDAGHGRELLAGDGALNVRSVVVVHQPHGVAVRQLSHRPGVGHLRGRSGIFRRQRGRGQQGRRRDAGQQPAHPIVLHVMCSSRRIVKLAFHMYCTTARPRRQPQFAAVRVCLCYTRSYTSYILVISMF